MAETQPQPERPFNAEAMWQLMAEVQRFGFETARNVAERFADMADRGLVWQGLPGLDDMWSGWGSFLAGATDDETRRRFTSAATKMSEGFVEMWQVAWDTMAAATRSGMSAVSAGSSVDLGDVTAGETMVGQVNVHVGQLRSLDPIEVTCGSLVTGGGTTLEGKPDPAVIEEPAAYNTYQVAIRVAVPRDAPLGVYRGFVIAGKEPAATVPVHLRVVVG